MLRRNEVIMLASTIRSAVLIAVVSATAALGTGCYVSAHPGVEYGYEPVYYDDYVVYYDDGGRPYYYSGGRVRYVPRTYANYGRLSNHYVNHRGRYQRWYRGSGYRYRTYRRTRGRR